MHAGDARRVTLYAEHARLAPVFDLGALQKGKSVLIVRLGTQITTAVEKARVHALAQGAVPSDHAGRRG